jgi:hypothetical protein
MEWIDVNDRLPTKDKGKYLVYYGTTGMGGNSYHQSIGFFNAKRGRFSGEMDWTCAYYWMELPPPPKEDIKPILLE